VERWPLLISVPHAGTRVPDELVDLVAVSPEQLLADSDEAADRIYLPLADAVSGLVTCDVSRTLIDVNRAHNDRRPNGVVKARTFAGRPVFHRPPDPGLVDRLVARYHRPYHRSLARLAARARLGVDCHVMSAVGPKVAGDAGRPRPRICLGFADGTCPRPWVDVLADCLGQALGAEPSLNVPFRGGYIVRSRPGGIPWIQIELNGGDWLETNAKRDGVRTALGALCQTLFRSPGWS